MLVRKCAKQTGSRTNAIRMDEDLKLTANQLKSLKALKSEHFELAYLVLLTYFKLKPLSRWEKGVSEDAKRNLTSIGLNHLDITRDTRSDKRITQTIFGADLFLMEDFQTKFDGTMLDEGPETIREEGKFFGFPECCIENFASHGYKPNSVKPEIQKLFFHWICSADCDGTMKMVDKYRKIKQIIDDL